jgi:hypothetical protein
MSAGVPALPFEADPLIAEAKQRARRRRFLALGAFVVVVAAAAAGTGYELHSSANSLGVCATVPSGWKERTLPARAESDGAVAPATVVLTNFRFGRMDDLYGLTTRMPWPAGGVTVAVSNWGPSPKPFAPRPHVLRVEHHSFGGIEGAQLPAANFQVESNGRLLGTYVEVGTLTPATIAAANQALAGVRTCSA